MSWPEAVLLEQARADNPLRRAIAERERRILYGRIMYEIMRYWDDDHPEWDTEEHAFAAEPADMGRLALVEVGRPQRQACWG
jgi:hypothetical protein